MRLTSLLIVAALLLAACATSPTGRQQIKFMPEAEISQLGVAAYSDMKSKLPRVRDPQLRGYVTCVAEHLTRELGGRGPKEWEVTVFRDDDANAFALPGGKIGVYSGMLSVARNQHQLAGVMGHEMGHVVAEHANERVSTAYAAQAGLGVVGATVGQNSQLMAALGLGTQYGVLLPFERTQESESDQLGMELMARGGFDPRELIPFWENMERQGSKVPEFLSTHPSGRTRIAQLQKWMPQAMQLYEEARARGKHPRCG